MPMIPMSNFNSSICPWCGKVKQPPKLIFKWSGQQCFLTPPDVPEGDYCQGHTASQCSGCGWMVPLDYHSVEDCERLAAIVGRTRKVMPVPAAFYHAFGEEPRP